MQIQSIIHISSGQLIILVSTKMIFFSVSVFRLIIIFTTVASFEISTFPETTADEEKILVLKEGLKNYTIVCNVTNDGAIWNTNWYIERPSINSSFAQIGISYGDGLVNYPTDLVDEVIITGPPLIGLITYAREFLIKDLTLSFHMAKLQCGTLNTRRRFLLKIKGKYWFCMLSVIDLAAWICMLIRLKTDNQIYVIFLFIPTVVPIVYNDSAAVIEGSNISITLNVSASGLPGELSKIWKYNGEELMSTAHVNVQDYYVKFTSINRDQAGTYSLTVGNGIENSTGYFTLDIYCK